MTSEQNDMPRRSLIGRFSQWLFSWRTVRRGLVALACLATLIAAFYTEENWRGKRAWEKCKQELEAQGEVLDWAAYIPQPVPDEQNIFKAPKMQEWFVGRGATELSRKLTNSATGSVGSSNVIQDIDAAKAYLNWSDQITNDFNTIREALKRPYARMDGDYDKPFEIPIPNFVAMRMVAQTLAQRTHCHLLLEQPENALRDLTLLHDLRFLLEAKPSGKPMSLVAAMINVAVTGLYANTIADGMRMRAWHEPQLAAIQKQLEEVNLPPLVRLALQSEPAAVCRSIETLGFGRLMQAVSNPRHKPSLWERIWNWIKGLDMNIYALAPRGWLYQNMAVYVRLTVKYCDGFENDGQEIVPHQVKQSQSDILAALSHRTPFNVLARVGVPNFSRAFQTTVHNQTLVNETFIVCALERYRLAHGQYPETLDALVPQFADTLPHEVIGSQPLHYRRTDNGGFVLYSVGWNETDDGGQIVRKKDGTVDTYSNEGDWVWSPSAN